MEFKLDSSNNHYLEVPLGWDDDKATLRLTFIELSKTVRLNKVDAHNHVFPGPEFDLKFVPQLIEGLIKTYNDNQP